MWMQECASCASSKNAGLQIWMRHLTEEHVLPSEWPSDRAARLTGPAAMKPYTTITESKKKRRKDSVPRPLNSFMLFAQHIRRNVLRVYSDASNSVISQQLGDLWRTVPLRLRNQYDEEANRLVKIHQLEFPNYKYQPKKRVTAGSAGQTSMAPSSAAAGTTTAGPMSCVVTATGTASAACLLESPRQLQQQREMDCTRWLNRSHITRDTDTAPVDLFSVRPRLYGIGTTNTTNTTASVTSGSGFTYSNEYSLKQQSQQQQQLDTTVRVISPQKCSVKALYTRVESKRPIPPGSGLYKSSSNSLSSVLPPLLTPSLSCPATTYQSCRRSGSLTSTDSFQAGSCDSAYASGINSSSSSSASSPAVGELLSPAKSLAGIAATAAACGKSSPVRRRIQFIPIRPQSQQLPPVHGQLATTTRQRFLSATNGSTSPLIESPTNSEPVYFMSSANHHHHHSLNGFDSIDEVDSALQPIGMPHQHYHQQQLLTPVYVRLEADGATGSNDELILALPPGTTVIQTVSSLDQLQSIQSVGSRRIYVTGCGKSTAANGSTRAAPIQLMQPVKFMNVVGRTVRSETGLLTSHHNATAAAATTTATNSHSTFEDLSPPPYSSNSSCSSVLSPLSNDVFLPLHHHRTQHPPDTPSSYGTHSLSPVETDDCLTRRSNFVIKSEEEMAPVYDAHPHDDGHHHKVLDAHQFDMEVDQSAGMYAAEDKCYIKMEEMDERGQDEDADYLTDNSVFGTTMLNGSVTPWPDTTGSRTGSVSGTVYGLTRSVSPAVPLPPLTVDVLKSSASPCAHTSSLSTSTVAMVAPTSTVTPNSEFRMSTVDEDVDQFDTSFDAMMNSIDITTFLPGTFSTADDDQLVDAEFDHVLSASVPGILETETLIADRSDSYTLPESTQTADCCSVYPLSPYSDLDALDKSSLFVMKQEWPVIV